MDYINTEEIGAIPAFSGQFLSLEESWAELHRQILKKERYANLALWVKMFAHVNISSAHWDPSARWRANV